MSCENPVGPRECGKRYLSSARTRCVVAWSFCILHWRVGGRAGREERRVWLQASGLSSTSAHNVDLFVGHMAARIDPGRWKLDCNRSAAEDSGGTSPPGH